MQSVLQEQAEAMPWQIASMLFTNHRRDTRISTEHFHQCVNQHVIAESRMFNQHRLETKEIAADLASQ